MTSDKGFFEKQFKLKEHGTDVKTEVIAGITTFFTMAYILAVNPGILSVAGMDYGAVFTATALSAMIATLFMAFFANLPFVLAPGMGLNAFFAFSVVLGMGVPFQFALTAVFLEGIIFLILTFFNIREAIIDSIPVNLKRAVTVGIGLFIAFIGFRAAGIVVSDFATYVKMGNLTSTYMDLTEVGVGITSPLLTIIGLFITGTLLYKDVKGSIFIGIIVTTIIGFLFGITQLPASIVSLPPKPTMFAFEFNNIFSLQMLYVLFAFLFVDMFDTIGTLIGVSTKGKMLDEEGKLPGIKMALFADAVGTTVGACLGTSTVTTYVESAAGVAEGGRTGLTALVAAGMFGLSMFLAPLFGIVTEPVTAAALIIVGLFMMSPIKEIDLDDYTEAIPAFLTIMIMPLTFSIANGILAGIVSYVVLKVVCGRAKDVPVFTYIVAAILVTKVIADAFM